MAKESKTKRRVRMILFMALISTLFVTAVSAVHLATRTIIKRNESLFIKKSVLYTAGLKVPSDPKLLDELFTKTVKHFKGPAGLTHYRVLRDGKTIWVFTQSGSGLWGEIKAHIGFTGDLKSIAGIDFIVQNETPGLGARIAESWFREQFRGKTGPLTMVPEGTKNEGPRQFDAITGATVTSTAVQSIVNTTLKRADALKGGVK